MESLLLKLKEELLELENELEREGTPEIAEDDELFRRELRDLFLINKRYAPMTEEKIAFIEAILEVEKKGELA